MPVQRNAILFSSISICCCCILSQAEVKSLRAQLAAAESGGGGGKMGAKEAKEFAAKSKDMERERASLQMRAMQAEEELKNFQQFLQTESMKKEQVIAALRKEVAMWKQKAGGA